MAKQLDDVVTGDLVGNIPARRGRPPTGKAMSAADRKRKSREALGVRGLAVDLPLDVIEGLERYRLGKDMTLSQVIEKVLRSQLLRPR
jgi:hypothetical protein